MKQAAGAIVGLLVFGVCSVGPALGQKGSGTPPETQAALNAQALYEGWRGRSLLGQTVTARSDGRTVGEVRDIIVDADGRAVALVIETSGTGQNTNAVYRIPWTSVDLTPGADGVRVDLSPGGGSAQYGLFPGTEAVTTLPREFRVSEVIGDYARLQTGWGYGLVTDVIFTPDGRTSAVLVTRDSSAGGGVVAFPFQGTTARWDPGFSYYGLPFVTDGQAQAAALRIDPKRFRALGS